MNLSYQAPQFFVGLESDQLIKRASDQYRQRSVPTNRGVKTRAIPDDEK